jgi:hypothetical protein
MIYIWLIMALAVGPSHGPNAHQESGLAYPAGGYEWREFSSPEECNRHRQTDAQQCVKVAVRLSP